MILNINNHLKVVLGIALKTSAMSGTVHCWTGCVSLVSHWTEAATLASWPHLPIPLSYAADDGEVAFGPARAACP
ncbi:hypothetical protein SKAU_G00111340 [Synaphobranchus kaupii]|uniref:Uncharacterized protein n=1 Tax=Synaphobranchus kaupii TaxID=118154 RepID=A0A9Q1G1M6_SYNKA|nr:hypothetical protein SKAU_G00111340 [Synaphobranchus kaupii]